MELHQALMALSSSPWLLKLRSQLGRQGLLHLSGEGSLARMVRLYYCACTFHFARRPQAKRMLLSISLPAENVALVPKFFFCDFSFLFLKPVGSMFYCLAGAVKLSSNDVTDDVFPVSKSPIKLDMGNDDEELVDEDALLTEEDLKAPEIPGASSSVDANGVMHAWKFSMSANR